MADEMWTQYCNLKGQRIVWRTIDGEYRGDVEFRIVLDDGQTVASDFLSVEQIAEMYEASQNAASAERKAR